MGMSKKKSNAAHLLELSEILTTYATCTLCEGDGCVTCLGLGVRAPVEVTDTLMHVAKTITIASQRRTPKHPIEIVDYTSRHGT